MKFGDLSRSWKLRALLAAVLMVVLIGLLGLISKVKNVNADEYEQQDDIVINGVSLNSTQEASGQIKTAASQANTLRKPEVKTTTTSAKRHEQGSHPLSKTQENEDKEKTSEQETKEIKDPNGDISVAIYAGGEEYLYEGRPVTVEILLSHYGIELGEDDSLSVSLDYTPQDGDEIVVSQVTYDRVTETEDGYRNTYLVTYVNGEPVDWELLESEYVYEEETDDSYSESEASTSSEETASPSEPATVEAPKETTPEPEPEPEVTTTSAAEETSANTIAGYTYSNVINCKAYAYTAYPGALGASGNPAVVGTCAVDPSVIPMGSRLYIEGYGFAIANDTGGDIIGNTVDVFMSTESECVYWGVQYVNVYILD